MTNQQHPDIIEIGGVKYKRIVENPKPETLFDIIYEWKYNTCDPTCEKLVDMIESEWLPLEGSHDGKSYIYSAGWNDCIKYLKKNLK
jgi:hypothetical protein